jgi:hypothetical protein
MHRFLLAAMLVVFLIGGKSEVAQAQDITVSYQTFYDNLAPYGHWIYDSEYGNVWVPNEGGDFRPYGSRGQWVMTEYGNTWVSDDPWGWAVYHYGRWTYNPYYGWIWVPGYEWAPAWVSWRFGGGYAGWAPLGPGINVGMTYYAPDSWWVFVGPQYMYRPNCMSYWRGQNYNTTYIRQTTIVNNYYVDNGSHVRYNYGPRAEVIQRVTRQPVQVYRVSHLNRPGAPSVGRNSVSLYRPSVNRATINDARPSRVVQAPRPVGRAQAAQPMGTGRQPAFRQDVQRMQPSERGGRADQPNNSRTNGTDARFGNRPQPNQPGRQDMRQQQNQPGREDARPSPSPSRGDMRQQQNQPGRQETRPSPSPSRGDMRQQQYQPGRQETRPTPSPSRQDARPTPTPQRQETRPQPQRQETRPQPQRQETRPQPQRQETRPQPQRQETRPAPSRQESRPQPGRTPTEQRSTPSGRR